MKDLESVNVLRIQEKGIERQFKSMKISAYKSYEGFWVKSLKRGYLFSDHVHF